MLKRKLIYGVGINDSLTPTAITGIVKGTRKNIWVCPYYKKWTDMLARCYSPRVLRSRPNYLKCEIADEWKYLSNFIKWVDSQPNRDWEKCHLDKDLLTKGNNLYSPENSVFISPLVNTFILFKKNKKHSELLGVHWSKRINKYIAQCNDPFNTTSRHLSVFNTELDAHLAWQAKKHEYACMLADLQADPRVADALRQRYSPDKDWTTI